MTLARPQADVPIVQMSVLETEDPESHLRIGRALQKLREKNIAIVGSGFASFHNLRIMMAMRHANPVQKAEVRGISEAWNGALAEALKGTESEKRWGHPAMEVFSGLAGHAPSRSLGAPDPSYCLCGRCSRR
uniref:Extradiol ring-cleavage dioxygenase class III enzyme subunit B domain-containing protein n=1 Tax=Bionectria ochroleuca TaxID=29856 RepID=A0A8H7N5U8_BIOOC